MEAKDWMQLLVGVVILGSIAWLGTNLFEMKSSLSVVEVRIGDIADEMPAVGKQFAWREVEAPLKGAVLASVPSKQTDGSWGMHVSLLDLQSAERLTYTIALDGEGDRRLPYAIGGTMFEHEKHPVSIGQLQRWSHGLGRSVEVPGILDADNSFVIRRAGMEDCATALTAFAGEPQRDAFEHGANNWWELSEHFAASVDVWAAEQLPE